jgi:hypothetical protein
MDEQSGGKQRKQEKKTEALEQKGSSWKHTENLEWR